MSSHGFNIVLVHGAFVDGSGWEPVYQRLRREGFNVTVVQNPTLSLEGDVAATKLVIAAQDRPVILVGHSYGGAVITEAGNDPKVSGLVYVCAFAPDAGETVQALLEDRSAGAPVPPILPPRDGAVLIDPEKFHAAFAADVDAEKAQFMADSQNPCGVAALGTPVSKAAWHDKPSWYLVATEDRMIPPPNQRMMARRAQATVAEVRSSHSIFLSHPDAVATLIATAADSKAIAA